MNIKNKINAEPIINTEAQKAVGLNENSWVIIKASTEDSTEIFYFNNEINPEEYETFEGFVEANMDDFYCPGDNPQITKNIKENYATISGYDGSMEDDYDEDSGKSWKQPVGKAAIMDFHKGGITQENLPEILKKIHKELDDLESQGAYEAADSYEYNKDPYRYYGVSRKDFM